MSPWVEHVAWGTLSLYIAIPLCFALLSYVVVTLFTMKFRSNKQVKGFEGPNAHWLKGNINDITFDGHGLAFHIRCTERFKTAYRVWFGPLRSALVLCHPETAGVVLAKNAPKERFFYKFLFPFLGNGLGLQEGEKWWYTRKLITPAFHFDVLKRYVPLFQESAKVLVRKWSKGGKVELFQDISLMTLDSVLKCAFSYSSHCQTEGRHDKYIKAINGIAKALLDRLLNPFYHFDWLYRLTPARNKFMQYCDLIHQKSDEVIMSRRYLQKVETNGLSKKTYRDFLDILLEAEDVNGNRLNNDDIRAEVNTFMFAGHDTVASALCWTLYCLAANVEHQRICQQEIDKTYEGNGSEQLDWDDINNLTYLNMCMKESMRLFSPVPVIGRTLDEEYVIDGKRVPEGTFVLVCIYAVHRNPHVWEKPRVFNPKRFESEKVEGRSAYAFIPFSGGPRNCMGKNFGLTEMKASLATILHSFDLSVDDEDLIQEEDDLFPELVLRSKNGVRIKVKPRTREQNRK